MCYLWLYYLITSEATCYTLTHTGLINMGAAAHFNLRLKSTFPLETLDLTVERPPLQMLISDRISMPIKLATQCGHNTRLRFDHL